MSEFDHSQKDQPSAELNRRKPENRWVRILRDAEWDQNETVRWWLRLARTVLRDKEQEEKNDETKHSDETNKAA